MKKIVPIILIVLLIGAGYFFLNNKKQKNSVSKKTQENTIQKQENIAQKIKEMISKNLKIKCTYQTDNKTTKVTTYLKGENNIRVKIEGKNQNSEAIFIKGKMYSWDNKTKQGLIISINQLTEKKDKTIVENPKKYIEELEKTKTYCQQENFSDSIFQPPANIKFQDLDKIQEMMNQGNFQIEKETNNEN
ncbi:MAG: hypothetical protein NZM02_02175 [Patescibacteria group bacterium]|nr:hypothetical protein [Patescibacteria group bacterium]